MSAQAKEIIAQWRKEINSYRKSAKQHVREYIVLVDKSTDDQKERLIDMFESFNRLAEPDVNSALFKLDDYLSKIDEKMQNDSSDDEFEAVRVLPSAKRVKMMTDAKAKAEIKSEAEESEEVDSTEESESD